MMDMFEVGRVVMKVAGRDAKKIAVIVEQVDTKTVVIDGQTRRRKVNVAHLEPLNKTVNISKGASTQDVAKALADINVVVIEKKNSHKSAIRQTKKRAGKPKKIESKIESKKE